MLRHASTVLCAHEASVSMYAVDAAGLPVVGDPLWPGGCAQRIALRSSLATDRFAATGASHAKTYHLDEMHEVRFDRLWVLRDTGEDFSLRRGQELVLDIQWQDAEPKAPPSVLWHRCVFRGAKSLSHDRASEGLDEFGASQVFTAERVETSYGIGMVPAAATHQMLYLREDSASEGAWLTGAWAWRVPCALTSVLLQAGRAVDPTRCSPWTCPAPTRGCA